MAIVAAGVAVAGGVYKAIDSGKKAKRTREAIANYTRQTPKNAYEDLTVSTLAADLQREELARATASNVQLLKSGGVRGVVGGAGKVQQANVVASRTIGADLDRQQKAIDQLRAQDEVRIQNMIEKREEQDLAGLGTQLNVHEQGKQQGINTAVSGVGSALGAVGGSQSVTDVDTTGQGFNYRLPASMQGAAGAVGNG